MHRDATGTGSRAVPHLGDDAPEPIGVIESQLVGENPTLGKAENINLVLIDGVLTNDGVDGGEEVASTGLPLPPLHVDLAAQKLLPAARRILLRELIEEIQRGVPGIA